MNPIAYFLLSLLWLSHGLVDRLGLSEERARTRGSALLWAAHAAQLTLLGAACLLFGLTRLGFSSQPMPPSLLELGLLAVGFGLLHLLTDVVQTRMDAGDQPSPASEAADQLVHLGLTAAAVWVLSIRHPEWSQLGSGPILILGQAVELVPFATKLCFAGLVLWITGAILRTQLAPRLQALLAAERLLFSALILASPLWLAAGAFAGRFAWMRLRKEPAERGLPSLTVLLMAALLRALLPAV